MKSDPFYPIVRVSILDQNSDLQKDALEKAGCEKVIVDQLSGTVASCPGPTKVAVIA